MAKVLLLLLLGGSFVFGFAFAQEECEPRGDRPEETRESSWQVESTDYQCGNNACGGTVQQRTIEEEIVTRTFYTPEADPETQCPIWKANTNSFSSGAKRTGIANIALGKYEACAESANNQWVSSFPGQCSGKCYPVPEILPLNNESLQPKNIFDVVQGAKLPLNVGWKNNVEEKLSLDGGSCQVSSYQYKVKQGSSVALSEQVSGSSHSAVVGANSCTLQPASNYAFELRACAGNTCSQPGTLSFSTSSAVQTLSPYDPDFEGMQGGIAPLPATLQWCPHQDAKSYKLSAYKADPDSQERKEEIFVFKTAKDTTQYIDSLFQGGLNLLSPLILYEWEVQSCKDSNIQICGIQSQSWRVLPGGELKAPNLRAPFDGKTVNMQDSFSWDFVEFASRYVIELSTVDADASKEGLVARVFVPTNPQLSLGNIWNTLSMDSSYSWKVAACGGAPESKDLAGCGEWSKERFFMTTGQVPVGLSVSPIQENKTALPITFSWSSVFGAASYSLQIGPTTSLNMRRVKEPRAVVDYPALLPSVSDPGTLYEWRVRTCADENGLVCGGWSATQTFRIAPLKAPAITEPDANNTEFFATTEFAWTKDFGSNYFTYQLNFLGPSLEEGSPLCQTPSPYPVAEGLPKENKASIRLRCLGEYQFNVSACTDKLCEAAGPQTTLKLNVQKFKGSGGGLIPCDANNDNPATKGLDEREPCQLKHLLLLVRNLVDFALWKLSLIILIAMTAFTGFTMYTSFGGMEVMAKVRSIWKAVGVGFLILLFSWLFLNLLLGIAGFQVNIFGKWHEVVL